MRRHALVLPGARVLVAVSGGSDSVALLHLLLEIARGEGREPQATGPAPFVLAGVAHLNHGLRGAASDGDEQFCRELAGELGLAFESAQADVAALARELHASLEVAARHARYEFLHEAAARLGADRIALGHTRNDQAETYLLRLLRGAGTSGLAGMAVRRGAVIRPVLHIGRDELRGWLQERAWPFREDASNADVAIPRNRVRHELLPLLAARFNPGIIDVLARNAGVARADEAWLEEAARLASAGVVEPGPSGGSRLSVEGLRALPAALKARVVRRVLNDLAGSHFCGFDQVEAVLQFAEQQDDKTGGVDLAAGLRMERNAGKVVLRSRGIRRSAVAHGWRYALPIPGSLRLPEADCTITAQLAPWDASGATSLTTPPGTALIDARLAADGLFVRSRRAGDTFRPLGLGGGRKLQDVLVDRKVPRADRDAVPIVVDGRDRILWVAGHLLAEDARVTDCTQSVVILKVSGGVRQLGDGV